MIYQGIRLTPAEIVAAGVAEDVHVVGPSVLSGSHLEVVVEVLRAHGVAHVFTPKDFELTEIMNHDSGSYPAPLMICDATNGSIRFDQTCSPDSRARCGMASSGNQALRSQPGTRSRITMSRFLGTAPRIRRAI